MNELIIHKGVVRTAPATPGLLTIRVSPGYPQARSSTLHNKEIKNNILLFFTVKKIYLWLKDVISGV